MPKTTFAKLQAQIRELSHLAQIALKAERQAKARQLRAERRNPGPGCEGSENAGPRTGHVLATPSVVPESLKNHIVALSEQTKERVRLERQQRAKELIVERQSMRATRALRLQTEEKERAEQNALLALKQAERMNKRQAKAARAQTAAIERQARTLDAEIIVRNGSPLVMKVGEGLLTVRKRMSECGITMEDILCGHPGPAVASVLSAMSHHGVTSAQILASLACTIEELENPVLRVQRYLTSRSLNKTLNRTGPVAS